MPERTSGLYNGQVKEASTDIIFASIFTLSMKKHRECFDKNDFDLIIVDEFHHAAAKSYRAVIDYFKPKFLLGLTATPDRMDGKDVYALCDGNVAYRIHFIEAISKGWLSPFRYFGVYDDTDYTQIKWLGNRRGRRTAGCWMWRWHIVRASCLLSVIRCKRMGLPGLYS
jgi:superfamily II DNA or RNA helicase